MRDYQGTEKIGDPPRRLSTEDAPNGCLPAAGDLTLYAPWGNLAVFYRDFWSTGLIPRRGITSGLEKLAAAHGDFTMTMERVEKKRPPSLMTFAHNRKGSASRTRRPNESRPTKLKAPASAHPRPPEP